MKIFLLHPVKDVMTTDFINKVKKLGEVEAHTKPMPILKVPGITKPGDKIIAMNPLFTDWKLEGKDLTKIPDLKAIVISSTSFSWIDDEFTSKNDILIINVETYSTEAVAEWAIMMALCVAKRIPILAKDSWKMDFGRHKGVEMNGKIAGIIGLGNIGLRIAELCQGLGMDVMYWSKNSRDKRFELADLDKLMKTADYVFPVLAHNDETEGIITDAMIRSLKKNAIFVSVVHKEVYNRDLLMEMAEKGEIYGFADEEEDISLLEAKGNVWTGQALAWCTQESYDRNCVIWLENMKNAINGDFKDRVN